MCFHMISWSEHFFQPFSTFFVHFNAGSTLSSKKHTKTPVKVLVSYMRACCLTSQTPVWPWFTRSVRTFTSPAFYYALKVLLDPTKSTVCGTLYKLNFQHLSFCTRDFYILGRSGLVTWIQKNLNPNSMEVNSFTH